MEKPLRLLTSLLHRKRKAKKKRKMMSVLTQRIRKKMTMRGEILFMNSMMKKWDSEEVIVWK